MIAYDYEAREKETVTACNLCGSTDLAELSRRDRYGFAATLWMCRRCGLGFLSPRLTAAEYARFYKDIYRPLVSAYHGRRIDAETVQVDQRGYTDDLVEFLRANLPALPRTVMDVGGSTGVVASGVRRAFGAEATVLDPAPDELAVAAAAGMETIAGFAEDFDPGERRWDLVLLCQTIDHLLDVRATLESMREMIARDGYAFIDVLDLLIAARKKGTEGAAKIDHPYYLTHGSALAFLGSVGFEPVAERLSDDGHWGFLVRPAEPLEPDWDELERGAAAMIEELQVG